MSIIRVQQGIRAQKEWSRHCTNRILVSIIRVQQGIRAQKECTRHCTNRILVSIISAIKQRKEVRTTAVHLKFTLDKVLQAYDSCEANSYH